MRNIANANFLESTSPLFRKLKILKLKDLYKFHVVLDAHIKIQNGSYQVSHNLQTRNRNLAQPKFHRLSRCQQSCTFNGPNNWNKLPIDIQNTKSISAFKSKVKSYYLSGYDIN